LLVPQEDLSPKARELAERLDRARPKAADYQRMGDELEAIQERARTAPFEDREKIRKEFEEKGARHKALFSELGLALETLQRDLERALALTPDDAGLRDVKSQFLDLIGEFPSAATELDRLLEKRPGHPPYVIRRASLLRKSGRYEEARTRLEPHVKDHPAAAAEDGLSAYCLNRFDVAIERLKGALKTKGSVDALLAYEAESTLAAARERAAHWKAESAIREREAKADDLPRVRIVTDRGTIEAELFENEAPVAVASFVALAEGKFFDGTRFHYVRANFLAQGGDPNSRNDDPKDDGQGGPGYSFADEFPVGKFRRHFRGTLSMANVGPDTNGSQFFIAHRPLPRLDAKNVVFGRVTSGMDVADRLQPGDRLLRVEIVRKRGHEYRTPE
jgi:cyclophilin family peptidyl-prolyl cis-trans isomerase